MDVIDSLVVADIYWYDDDLAGYASVRMTEEA